MQEYGAKKAQAEIAQINAGTAKVLQDTINSKALTASQIDLNSSSAKANYAEAQGRPFKILSDKVITPVTSSKTYRKFTGYARSLDTSLSRLLP